jgi:hypothetical protein
MWFECHLEEKRADGVGGTLAFPELMERTGK